MDTLLKRLAAVRAVRASFQEEKSIALLAAPLRTQGTVHFAAPATLLRVQEAPAPAAMLLDGQQVHFRDESGQRSIDLTKWEVASGLVGGYLKVLQGDAAGLHKLYDAKFACDGPGWTLELLPRAQSLKKIMRRMTLRGTGTRLTGSEMVDGHGDRTRTTFSAHAQDTAGSQAAAGLRRRFAAMASRWKK